MENNKQYINSINPKKINKHVKSNLSISKKKKKTEHSDKMFRKFNVYILKEYKLKKKKRSKQI